MYQVGFFKVLRICKNFKNLKKMLFEPEDSVLIIAGFALQHPDQPALLLSSWVAHTYHKTGILVG
jgi:hypothetical protein